MRQSLTSRTSSASTTPIDEPPGAGFRSTFFRFTNSGDVELVAPTGAEGPVAKRLASSGPGVYMLTMATGNLAATLQQLRARVSASSAIPAWEMPPPARCFIHPASAGGVLTEIVQHKPIAILRGVAGHRRRAYRTPRRTHPGGTPCSKALTTLYSSFPTSMPRCRTSRTSTASPRPISANRPGAGFKNAFFRMGESDIELVSPTGDQGPVAKRLAASGEGVYLVALKVDNLQATVDDLRAKGIRLVGDPGPGNPVTGQVFVHPSAAAGILTQLVER